MKAIIQQRRQAVSVDVLNCLGGLIARRRFTNLYVALLFARHKGARSVEVVCTSKH